MIAMVLEIKTIVTLHISEGLMPLEVPYMFKQLFFNPIIIIERLLVLHIILGPSVWPQSFCLCTETKAWIILLLFRMVHNLSSVLLEIKISNVFISCWRVIHAFERSIY